MLTSSSAAIRGEMLQCQDIAYAYIRTSFTFSGIIYLQKKERIITWKETTTMEQKIEFIRVAIRELHNHRALQKVFNLIV